MSQRKSTRRTAASKRSVAAIAAFEADHLYSVVFSADSVDGLDAVASTPGIDCGCRHPTFRRDEKGVHLGALVRGSLLQTLAANRQFRLEVVSDQTEASRAALQLVGKGDRFRNGRELPQGIGRLV